MITRCYTVPIVICMLLAPIAALAADSMTHEETVVRTAYAKFSYASQQFVATQLATESMGVAKNTTGLTDEQRLLAAQVHFALSNFTTGNVQNILNRKAVDFITPNQEMLVAQMRGYQYDEGGTMFVAKSIEPQWQPMSQPPEVSELKIADLYQAQWQAKQPTTAWQTYVSYSVVVSFQGKTYGPYKAMFIFGHDAKGNETIYPEDAVTDATGLALALREPMFPDLFLRSRLRNYPAVSKWMGAIQAPACSASHEGDVCCDLATLQCGPGRDAMSDAIAKPLPTPGKP